jgi:exopolysaccharide biosynthesis polyprenyl glycosylphosphotransferase
MIPNTVSTARERAVRPLPRVDIRRKLDEVARRGWIEIGRRTLRVGLLIVSDLLALTLASIATVLSLNALFGVGLGTAEAWPLFRMMLFLEPLTLGVATAYGAGHSRTSFGRVLLGVTTAMVLATLQLAMTQGSVLPPVFPMSTLPLFWAWTIAITFALRLGIEGLVSYAYSIGLGQRRVLVIGSEAEAAKLMEMLRLHNAAEIRVVGRLSPTHRREQGALSVVGGIEAAVEQYDAWGVIVASSHLSFEALETIFQRCFELGVAVSVIPKTLHRFGPRLELRKTRAGALLRLHPRELGIPQLTIKRVMDLTLSIIVLLVLWPVLVAIAIGIKLDSPGPIFFKQVRAGLGGQPFGMYKFRTMVTNADEIKAQLHHLNESGDPRLFKIRNDPRTTRVGRLLRKMSLDELPQLFNVLAGDMSLIGPRPFFPNDLDEYDDHHFERLSVLPGITGWWQVRGRSAVLDFDEVVRLDLEYIERWSVWFDLKILLLTLPTVLRRTGAY